MWQFEIIYPDNRQAYAIWCEKGLPRSEEMPASLASPNFSATQHTQIENADKPKEEPDLCLQDFSFLSG
eukprot:CAMPEP_0117053840 /NCGR_PEP_ID=MMETSP0472-20121206/37262_1 /TAXON_ID=693140 ORGANISM="Tiarina fusus, Strain LIS" /NCGR_SAMPLE_ID=MMETSP0472 /ASSEMBLY_ACC=CAM_ASM_000603 /LENGTH=68 /DNA_ID=CAMNT_0004769095 /DNA_START=322 /DNA_END=525 /DNA_ORIENTATION=-